jgi:hypothetical protein
MAKKKVFVSFDYNDKHLKSTFIGQARLPDSPFSISDFSLQEAHPENEWLSKAQSAIAKCDYFIVLLGNNTHQAPGVLKEVRIAGGLRKNRFQLRPQGKNSIPVPGAGEVITWKWKNIKSKLS